MPGDRSRHQERHVGRASFSDHGVERVTEIDGSIVTVGAVKTRQRRALSPRQKAYMEQKRIKTAEKIED